MDKANGCKHKRGADTAAGPPLGPTTAAQSQQGEREDEHESGTINLVGGNGRETAGSIGNRHQGNPGKRFGRWKATAGPGAPIRRPGNSVAVQTVRGVA